MKIILPLLSTVLFAAPFNASAQNVGVGTQEPLNSLHVEGNLLVTQAGTISVNAPAASQTKTMVNNTTIQFSLSDSVIRIFDPGGPSGNYSGNLLCQAVYPNLFEDVIGIEVTAENMDLGTGDSLIINETGLENSHSFVRIGNNYTSTPKWFLNCSSPTIIFKSNADGANGAGFSLLLRRFYKKTDLPQIEGIKKNGMFFNAGNGAFRSGWLNNAEIGENSTGMGRLIIASGTNSVAIGNYAEATETNSIAIGSFCLASGRYAFAAGTSAEASGDNSTAIGNRVSTNNEEGALVIGDNSTQAVMSATTPNSLRARFAGGYRFFTSAATSTAESCLLAAGSNAWSTTSDKRLKENFLAIDGEDFLKKIAAMKLTSWNYKQQEAKKFRHYGPMAQDFYAAFGKDKYGTIGNDTTINQADFDGVNLIAIQALEKRTAELKTENQHLKTSLLQQQLLIQKMQQELDALKKGNKIL